ncbi:hypothetical protein [Desulfovulcanus sp.]
MKHKVLQLGSPTGLYGAERWILALSKKNKSDRINRINRINIFALPEEGQKIQSRYGWGLVFEFSQFHLGTEKEIR